MKRQVIDELDRFVKHLKTDSEIDRNTFQYIDAVQLKQLSLEWSKRNVFSYSFPLDVLRKIFSFLDPKDYFRYARGLCKRMRQYLIEDVIILELRLHSKRKKFSIFSFHVAKTFTLNGLKLGHDIPLRRQIWQRWATHVDKIILLGDNIRPYNTWTFEQVYSYGRGPTNFSFTTYWKSNGTRSTVVADNNDPPKTACFSYLILQEDHRIRVY